MPGYGMGYGKKMNTSKKRMNGMNGKKKKKPMMGGRRGR